MAKTASGKSAPRKSAAKSEGTVPHVRTVSELRAIVSDWRKAGLTVGLVPTMGALHDGHLSLARIAKTRCDKCVMSIFVNPKQFAPTEDLASYPRTWDADLAAFASAGGDLVWAPTVDEMYPAGFATEVQPKGAALGLETDFRPHFFAGVATVCCKLFTQVLPDIAVFGEKDYQQLCVVRQMVRDLNLPLEIVAGETIRDADGLAMSSRNAYLSKEERRQAIAIHRAIQAVAEAARTGQPLPPAVADAKASLLSAGFNKVDYIEVRDAETLGHVDLPLKRPARVLAAAWLGKTRLIDNIGV
jgi:pantoate--beta-alanine ligase